MRSDSWIGFSCFVAESDVNCSGAIGVRDVWLVGKIVLFREFDRPPDRLLLGEDVVTGFRAACFEPPATFFWAAVVEPRFVDVDALDFLTPLLRVVVLVDPVSDGTSLWVAAGVLGVGVKHCLMFRMRQVASASVMAMM